MPPDADLVLVFLPPRISVSDRILPSSIPSLNTVCPKSLVLNSECTRKVGLLLSRAYFEGKEKEENCITISNPI